MKYSLNAYCTVYFSFLFCYTFFTRGKNVRGEMKQTMSVFRYYDDTCDINPRTSAPTPPGEIIAIFCRSQR